MNQYVTLFSSLHTAKIAGKQAPHKAVLLLAIMDLVEASVITSPKIVLTEKLEETFGKIWKHYIGSSLIFTPKVATPFWHIQNEPFYQLYLNNGKDVTGMKAQYSVRWLRENTYATIDKELFMLMKDENVRAQMRVILISTYLQDLHTGSNTMLSILTLVGILINIAA